MAVMTKELPLTAAAARVTRSYNVILRLVLCGEIEGWQDERGRWFVSLPSLDAWNGSTRRPAAAA